MSILVKTLCTLQHTLLLSPGKAHRKLSTGSFFLKGHVFLHLPVGLSPLGRELPHCCSRAALPTCLASGVRLGRGPGLWSLAPGWLHPHSTPSINISLLTGCRAVAATVSVTSASQSGLQTPRTHAYLSQSPIASLPLRGAVLGVVSPPCRGCGHLGRDLRWSLP